METSFPFLGTTQKQSVLLCINQMKPAKKASGSVVKAPAIPRGFIFLIKILKVAEKGIEFVWEELGI